MITSTKNSENQDAATWQQALSNCITDPAELVEILQLDPALLSAAKQLSNAFALRVPRGFVARMEVGNVNDPLLRQVLPIANEADILPGMSNDAVGDLPAIKMPGLLHKYHGRVLLTLSGACAINCRYCFRRAFPYQDNIVSRQQWQEILEYLRNDASIQEVIFSGGDPLIASDKRLAAMMSDLEKIQHVERVRFHSRLPIVLPERITADLIRALTMTRLRIIMVVHSNHANEVDVSVKQALKKLQAKNILLYNQAVLLKGINDNVDALVALNTQLFNCGVQPYYLHLLDKVPGVMHFEVPEKTAKELYAALQEKLPGYLVPRLVREIAGETAKTII